MSFYECRPYSYTASPQQKKVAQDRVGAYYEVVRKGHRRAATHRYIAVETLKPTKQQGEDYLKKRATTKTEGPQLAARSVDSTQLRCVMVFDTAQKEFVGSGCYVVDSLPNSGSVSKFDSISAEFVGQL